MAQLNERGHEILDDTPVAIPLRLTRPPLPFEEVRQMMSVISRQAASQGLESLEEANDFEIGDDYDPRSAHEFTEFEEQQIRQVLAEGKPTPKQKSAPVAPGASLPGVSGDPKGDGAAGGAASQPA